LAWQELGTKGEGSNLSQAINDLFSNILSTALSPEVMKNDLCNRIANPAHGWHIFGGREFESLAPKGLEMLTTLLLQKV
jgi:hypothetical protein